MLNQIKSEIKKTLVGKESAIEGIMIALLSGGHILIEDLPGLGKTTLAKAFSKAMNCTFSRIQFTPDLMPSDLIGVSIYDKSSQKFVFQRGPLFTNILLADEINRTSPKTQSSLLEAMEENQITIDGTTYILEAPFLVIATENPIELQGTFPLPEAQLDRFMMRVTLGYPTLDEEMSILTLKEKNEQVQTVIPQETLMEARSKMNEVYVDPAIKEYIVKLCKATREHASIKLGASPRASVHLFNGAKAKALLSDRDYVIASDVSELFEPIVAHRLILKGEAQFRGIGTKGILHEIIQMVEVPKVKR
jgi:MoxR-like ATPase